MTALQRRAVYLRWVAILARREFDSHLDMWAPLVHEMGAGGAASVADRQLRASRALYSAAIEADRCLGRDMIRRAVKWGA